MTEISPIKKMAFLAAALLLAAAAFVRLANLGETPLWADEMGVFWTTCFLAEKVVERKQARVPAEQQDPPLLPLAAKLFLPGHGLPDLTPETVAARFRFRLASAVAGWLAVVLVLLLGWRLAGWPTALTAAAFMAFLYYGVYYSREGRPYALIMFFACGAAVSIVALVRRPSHWWPAATLALSLAGAVYSHYFAAFMFVVVAAWIVTFTFAPGGVDPRQRRTFVSRAVVGTLIGALLYLPWASTFIWIIERHFDAFDLHGYHGQAPAMGMGVVSYARNLLGFWAMGKALWWPGAILAGWGLVFAWRNHRRAALLLGPWLFASWLVWPWLPGSGMAHSRYMIFAYPAYCLLLAFGVTGVGDRLREIVPSPWRHRLGRWVPMGLIVIVLLHSLIYLPEVLRGGVMCTGDPPQPQVCSRFIE